MNFSKPNTRGLEAWTKEKVVRTRQRIDEAISRLLKEEKLINFQAVAQEARVAKAVLYRYTDIRERIESLRTQQLQSGQKLPPSSTRTRSDASKNVLIEAQKQRIKVLETEVKSLREELRKAYAAQYEQLT
ncbi:MAG: DUF6262 family protein [Syntrophales bacterium]